METQQNKKRGVVVRFYSVQSYLEDRLLDHRATEEEYDMYLDLQRYGKRVLKDKKYRRLLHIIRYKLNKLYN